MGFFATFIVLFAAEFGLKFLLAQFIANTMLIDMIVSFVISFILPIFLLPKEFRSRFYKIPQYHTLACILTIVFLGMDLITWMM